jgi:peptide/nickel transport system ATP-binding protein
VQDLDIRFDTRERRVHAVNGVSFTVRKGEVLCLLGESGSGKSVTLRAVLKLLPDRWTRIQGRITVAGRDLMCMGPRALSELRGAEVAMIFQEPMTAFDPVFTIGQQIIETLTRHQALSRAAARRRAIELLEMVQIPSPERRLRNYPHEMSGGMRQRAMIAMALSCGPSLLLADEPTTALDATVQIQILHLLRRLQREMGMAMVLVTHDVGVAAEIADRVAVMYAGRLVEVGSAEEVLLRPAHPYTRGLLASTVQPDSRGARLEAIPGAPVDLAVLPPGCAFASRCGLAESGCHLSAPPEIWRSPQRMVRCVRADPPEGARAG